MAESWQRCSWALTQGRFTSQDPIRFASGQTNHYQFVGNHPHMGTDPSGLVEKYRHGGHHFVPWEIYKNFSDEIKSVFDADGGRISNKYYHFHNFDEFAGIKHSVYNELVEQEMASFLKGKKMTVSKARDFLDYIKEGNNSVIKAFNEAVKLEADTALKAGENQYKKLREQGLDSDEAFAKARDVAEEEGKHIRASLNAKAWKRGLAYKIQNNKIVRYGLKLGKTSFLGFFTVGTSVTLVIYGEYSAAANETLLNTTPLGLSVVGGELLGEFYEYAQDEIRRSAAQTPDFLEGGKGRNDATENRQIIVPETGPLKAFPIFGRDNWKRKGV